MMIGDRLRALALQPVELVHEEGAVVEPRQHVVGAEKFEIGLGLLARGDVGQRDLHQRPVALMAGQHRELQQQMQLGAVERIVHDLALLEQLAVPQVDELLAEMRLHLVAEHVGQADAAASPCPARRTVRACGC